MTRAAPVALLAVLVLASGCAEDDTVPITDRAIAAIALDHLPGEPRRIGPVAERKDAPDGLAAATLRLDDTGYEVAVYPDDGSGSCSAVPFECETVDSDEGDATLSWEAQAGFVTMSLERNGELGYVLVAGEPFSGRPDAATVARLLGLLEDPRLRLDTTRGAVDAGERLEPWAG